MQIPQLGFGTYRLIGKTAYESVKQALACGYRHIDTAESYHNEAEIGQAIIDSNIAREDLFLTTKIWNDNLGSKNFINSVKQSLNKLQTDYVDLLLIHWPVFPAGVSLDEAIDNLLEAKRLGLTKNIGVSNFTIYLLSKVLARLPAGEEINNQVEIHPYLQNQKLISYCQKNEIRVTAYMPFAVGKIFTDKVILSIANKHNTTPAQVVIAWLNQLSIVTIPSSTKQENMSANLKSLSLTLDKGDMMQMRTLECNGRLAAPDFSPLWD